MGNKNMSVTKKVILYQQTQDDKLYQAVKKHYDNFKKFWYKKFRNYMDWDSFESEYDLKLCQSIKHFDAQKAKQFAEQNDRSESGMFNRFFFQVKSNWWLNVKMASYRHKRRPLVQCPACGRMVAKIDEEHLKHQKDLKDLPKAFIYKGQIYEVKRNVTKNISSWGEAKDDMLEKINSGEKVEGKNKISWPWHKDDGSRGVMCPFVKRIISKLDVNYLRSLPAKYSCYAPSMNWQEFIDQFPSTMLESEVYSLEFSDSAGDDCLFGDKIEKDFRRGDFKGVDINNKEVLNRPKDLPSEYEHSFHVIEKCVGDNTDKDILKLIAIGYSIEDISDTLNMEKRDIRKRIRSAKSMKEMEHELQEVL